MRYRLLVIALFGLFGLSGDVAIGGDGSRSSEGRDSAVILRIPVDAELPNYHPVWRPDHQRQLESHHPRI